MSSALAIAAVSASIKDLLNNGLIDHDLSSIGSFTVTAQPPDRITTGQTESNQLNLFLYRVSPNTGWRNAGLPSRDGAGARVSNPPLALDLHYLLTSYGAQDLNAEVLLGYAMQLLHETPVLTRQQLRRALATPEPIDGTILPGALGTLSALDLADQIELIKITPVYLSAEDLSKLWTAMQARYRPSMAYTASVVLIQSTGSARSALPVLKRGADDRGPTAVGAPLPSLTGARSALSEALPGVRLGDDLLLTGSNLDVGVTTVQLACARLGITQVLAPGAPGPSGQRPVHLPSAAQDAAAMSAWGVGLYGASLRVVRPARPGQPEVPAWSTNSVPVALVPSITVSPLAAAPGTLTLTVKATPRLRPEQEDQTRLVFGTTEVAPATIVTPADPTLPTTLTFTVADVTAGKYVVRLRVDGIDSLPVTATGAPVQLDFDPQQTVTVA